MQQQEKVLLTPFWIIAATFVGLGDTLWLSYEKFLGIIPSCAILNGCEKVLTSQYASFLGIPLAYFGLVFYAYMLALGMLLVYDPAGRGTRAAMVLYTGLGVLFSLGFESIQIFLIGAICMYCAISALTSLTLFSLAVWHFRATKNIQ